MYDFGFLFKDMGKIEVIEGIDDRSHIALCIGIARF